MAPMVTIKSVLKFTAVTAVTQISENGLAPSVPVYELEVSDTVASRDRRMSLLLLTWHLELTSGNTHMHCPTPCVLAVSVFLSL